MRGAEAIHRYIWCTFLLFVVRGILAHCLSCLLLLSSWPSYDNLVAVALLEKPSCIASSSSWWWTWEWCRMYERMYVWRIYLKLGILREFETGSTRAGCTSRVCNSFGVYSIKYWDDDYATREKERVALSCWWFSGSTWGNPLGTNACTPLTQIRKVI